MTDIELITKIAEEIMSANAFRNITIELPTDWNKNLICLNLRFIEGKLVYSEAY